jgi:DICT domain-containing protein
MDCPPVARSESRAYAKKVGRFQKCEDRARYLLVLKVTSTHFIGDVDGRVTGPAFRGIEDDNADWIVIVAREQIAECARPSEARRHASVR